MPYRPEPDTYQHPDPLLRRLRLRDAYGKTVELVREFRDAEVVLFLFGCVLFLRGPCESANTNHAEQPGLAAQRMLS